MNEKIDEIINDMDLTPFLAGGDCPEPMYRHQLVEFAELIILECIAVMQATVKDADERSTYMGDDVPTSVHIAAIKRRFGI